MNFLVALFLLFGVTHAAPKSTPVFRFHLFVEPSNLDPQLTNSPTGNYLFNALYRGLFRYHGKKGLLKAGAESCQRSPFHLRCTLSPKHLWSSGERIKAEHYVAAFRRLIDPKVASPQSDVLFSLKNARQIWAGHKELTSLGVRAIDAYTLDFEFEKEDPEFEFRLIHPSLSPMHPSGFKSPRKATELITSGPFVIQEWREGAWIKFGRNPYFDPQQNAARPRVEALFIDDDATATNLYESGKLSFLRRIPSSDIPRFRGKPGFHQVGMARFDYIGFGPELRNHPSFRKALIEGVDFSQFLNLFDTRTAPGCPSLPARYLDRVECRKFNLEDAKAELKKGKTPARLEFHFSRMGGDDIARAAEYFQSQWRKNLELRMEIRGQEQAVFMQSLRSRPPALFRKGVNLERPTCLAALELFKKGHPENFIAFDEPTYEALLDRLSEAKSEGDRKRFCREAVEFLLNSNRLIPLGEMHFSIMASPDFSGWDLNELNQLDLSELTTKPK